MHMVKGLENLSHEGRLTEARLMGNLMGVYEHLMWEVRYSKDDTGRLWC